MSVLSTNGKMHAIFHSPVSLYYYHTCFMYRYIELMILWVLIPLLVIKQKESILRIVSEKLRKWIHLFVYYWKRFLLLCRNFEDFFKSPYFENITVHKFFLKWIFMRWQQVHLLMEKEFSETLLSVEFLFSQYLLEFWYCNVCGVWRWECESYQTTNVEAVW